MLFDFFHNQLHFQIQVFRVALLGLELNIFNLLKNCWLLLQKIIFDSVDLRDFWNHWVVLGRLLGEEGVAPKVEAHENTAVFVHFHVVVLFQGIGVWWRCYLWGELPDQRVQKGSFVDAS